MKKLVALVSVMLAFSIGSAFAASGIAGSWKVTMTSPRGTREVTLMIKEDKGAYTGTMQGAQGPVGDLKNVMVKGDDFSFVREINTPNGDITLNYSGKVDGDKISGTTKSQFGENPFTGTRQ
jgi:hypothetical protein